MSTSIRDPPSVCPPTVVLAGEENCLHALFMAYTLCQRILQCYSKTREAFRLLPRVVKVSLKPDSMCMPGVQCQLELPAGTADRPSPEAFVAF